MATAAVSPKQIADWAIRLNADCDPPVDAIVIACNGLRALGAIETIEQAINVPVVTSNQALLWNMVRGDGRDLPTGYGALAKVQPA
jgi:maleate isomerase